jgi:solute carrier family 25 carnitine/acylcarnitine transporter 20/29
MFLSNGEYIRWMSQNGTRKLGVLEYALGGSITWAVCTLIECPLQLASSQMQVEIFKQKSNPGYKSSYKHVFDFLYKSFKMNGIRGLYQGFAPHLMRNIPGGAFHFGLFEGIRRKWAEKKGVPVEKVGLGVNMVSGSIGGFFFWAMTYPQDVVKSAMQADSIDKSQRKYRGVLDCYKQLFREGGLKRFTRGFSACALRALPANAVLLTTAARVRELGYSWLDK